MRFARKLPHWLRIRVFDRDQYRCRYCGGPVYIMAKDPRSHATVDHVIPRDKGGLSTYANLVTACETCNHRKGRKLEMVPMPPPAMERRRPF